MPYFKAYLQPPGLVKGMWTERSLNITTSRGCPGRCTFCGCNYQYNDLYRRRSVDNVLAEIDMLVQKYDIDGISFLDDTFLMNTKWIEEFCEKLIPRKYKFIWSCYGRVDTANEKILRACKRAGCVQVELGIESGSDRMLKIMKKYTSRDKVRKCVEITKDVGLRTVGSFIIGYPEETPEDAMDTIGFMEEIKLNFVAMYYATPYPSTELYEQALKEDRIVEKDMNKWYVRSVGIMKTLMDTKTIMHYRQIFLKKARLRNMSYFLLNPQFLFKLVFFILKHMEAFGKSFKRALLDRSMDDLGYYFYTFTSNKEENRNLFPQDSIANITRNKSDSTTPPTPPQKFEDAVLVTK